MKKLLLAAAMALVGFAGLTASAEAFKDGHYYKLRNLDYPEFYLHMSGTAANATFDSEANATVLYLSQNPNNSAQFLIRQEGPTGNILGASSWNTICNDTNISHFWTVTEVANTSSQYPVVYLSQAYASDVNGTRYGDMGADYNGDTNTDKKLYGNKGASNHRNWEVIEVPMRHHVYYTIKIGNNNTYTLHEIVLAGERYSTPSLPTGVSISEEIRNAELDEDKAITVTVPESDHLFKLLSARYTNAWGSTSVSAITHTDNNKTFADGDWFLEIPEADNAENFKIWSVKQLKYVAAIPSSGAVTLSATTPGIFKIIYNANGAEAITNSTNTVGVNGDFFNHQLNGVIGRWHANNDAGSHWFMIFSESAWNKNKLSFSYSENTEGVKSVPTNTSQGRNDGSFNTDTYTFPYLNTLTTALSKQAELNALTITFTAAQTAAKNALDLAISNAQSARFGGKDVDMPVLLDAIETALTNLDNVFNEYYVTCGSFLPIAEGVLGIAAPAGVTAWNNFLTTFNATTPSTMTAQMVADMNTAYTALVNSTVNTPGGYVYIRHGGNHPTHYIAVNNEGTCLHTDATGTRALRLVPAFNTDNTQIGFYILNEYTNKYFKMPTAGDTTQEMVSEQSAATVFVFQPYPQAPAGAVKVKDVNATGTSEYLHANQGTEVMHWSASTSENDAYYNSSWFIERCEENAAVDEFINGAMHWSKNVSSNDLTGFYTTDVNAVNTARAMEAATTADKRAKGDAIYAALATQKLNMPTSRKVYTIRCTDTANSRGNLQYAEGLETIATSGRNGVAYNAEDAKQQWAIYKDADGKMYLYNLGARLFANIYYERPNHNGGATNEDFCWRFSKVPTEITEFNLDNMTFNATEGHGFNIYAAEGKNTTSGRHAGMFVVNGITEAPVPASAGFGATDNGIGFWLTEVGTVSEELQAEMKAAFDAASAEVTAVKGAYEAAAATEANEDLIGHYTDAGFRAYTAAGTAASAAADNDTKHFHYVKGLAAERVGLEHEAVYTLRSSENKHYAVIDGKAVYTDKAAATGENTHYWVASVDDNNVVSFTHTYQIYNLETKLKERDETVILEHNGATLFSVAHGAPGVVTLVPVESEAPAAKPGMRKAEGENAPLTFVITKAPDGSNATTTSIAEVESWSERSELIYDLQGRRLAAPARGINIIGGRKVLVK